MMLNVLLYFYLTGTHSPRDIARSLETNVALRFLAARNWPSHHAICGFRARDLPDIRTVFVDLLRMTQLAGLTHIGQMSIGNPQVQASVNRSTEMPHRQVMRERARLNKKVEALLQRTVQVDAQEDAKLGKGVHGLGLTDMS